MSELTKEKIIQAVKNDIQEFVIEWILSPNYHDYKTDLEVSKNYGGMTWTVAGALGIKTSKTRYEVDKLVKTGELLKKPYKAGNVSSYWPVGYLKELREQSA